MRPRMNDFHLGLVVLAAVVKEETPRTLVPLEEGHLDEAAAALQKIAETVQWLGEENSRLRRDIPASIFEWYDRAEKVLDVFGKKAEPVEFVARAARVIVHRKRLPEGVRKRLIPLVAKLEAAFDPFRNFQFERIEML